MNKVKAWESTYAPGHKNPKILPRAFSVLEYDEPSLFQRRVEALFRAMPKIESTVRISESRYISPDTWRAYSYGSIERIEKPKPLDYRTVFPEVVIDADAWNALVKERYPWLF